MGLHVSSIHDRYPSERSLRTDCERARYNVFFDVGAPLGIDQGSQCNTLGAVHRDIARAHSEMHSRRRRVSGIDESALSGDTGARGNAFARMGERLTGAHNQPSDYSMMAFPGEHIRAIHEILSLSSRSLLWLREQCQCLTGSRYIDQARAARKQHSGLQAKNIFTGAMSQHPAIVSCAKSRLNSDSRYDPQGSIVIEIEQSAFRHDSLTRPI